MNISLSTAEHECIVNQLAHAYGVTRTQLHPLTDNPDDGVYGFTRQRHDFVVKYTLQAARTFSTLQGQVDWVNFLAVHGAPVSRPVPSLRGAFVEQLPINDTTVSVVCYEHVPGDRPEGTILTADLFQTWGQVMGKIHALSTRYTPAQQHWHIRAWYEGATRDTRTIPADQTLVHEKCDALLRSVHALPNNQQVYGLIHGDFQANNLHVSNGVLWVFDFDDCEYNWFVSDIATALYFTLWEPHPECVLENMLAGYAHERSIGADWNEQIPLFLKLQEMSIYTAITAYNRETLPLKHQALLRRYRHNIEHDIPYIESAYCPWASD